MFKISVIIPCYNVSAYIDRCLNSLLSQTIGFENLQIILVDDASTDDTPKLLKHYESLYPSQISLILCEENGRQGAARNIGLNYALAPYIGFVDSDDWIEPDMYEQLYNKITEYDCDIVSCKILRDDASGQITRRSNPDRQDTLICIDSSEEREKFIVSEIIGVGVYNKLYKKDFLFDNDINFPEKLAYEDIYFGSLLYLYANRIYILDEYMYHYYVNWNSTILQLDKAYHKNIFTVSELLRAEYIKRGVAELFPMAVEYNFVKTYYLAGLKTLILRYSKPSYEDFLAIKRRTLEVAYGYKDNPHLKNAFPEIFELLLGLLSCEVSEAEFYQIAAAFKQLAQ